MAPAGSANTAHQLTTGIFRKDASDESEDSMRINYAMVFVSDMNRSVAFYRDVVGLPLKFQSPNWSEFATEGATLALHSSGENIAASGNITSGQAGSCRLGFGVDDIDAFHQRMVTHGVPCVQAPTPVFGARVAQYTDPDGLQFSVGESRAGAGAGK